jgi:hypothetical protein
VVPALIAAVAGAGLLSWRATRAGRAAAATERAIERIHARLTAELARLGAVPMSVSPDRQLAVMGRRLDEGYGMELVRLSDRRVLSAAAVDAPADLVWRPSGDLLAFSALDAGTGAVYLWGTRGEGPRAVDSWSGGEAAAHLVWDDRGDQLAFVRPEGEQSQRRLIRAVTWDGRGGRTLAVTTDVRGLDWTSSAPAAQLAVIAPPLCRDGIALLAAGKDDARGATNATVRCLSLGQDAELKDVAHDPHSGRLLFCRRARGAQFFSLSELDPGSGSVRTLAAPEGDVESPAYTAGGYLYHLERAGQSALWLDHRGHGFSPFAQGRTRLLGLSADRATAIVSHVGLITSPQVAEVSVPDGRTRPLLTSGPVGGPANAVSPEILVIDAASGAAPGVQLRDFWWRAPRPPARRKLVIEVATQAAPPDPTFRLPRHILIEEGFDVLQASFRGVPGFGAAFAEIRDPSSQAQDLAVTVRHVVERLGYRPAEIVVLAAGDAATLVAMAATLVPEHLQQMVLLNPARATCEAGSSRPVSRRRVTLIYGEGSTRSLAETEFSIAGWLGPGAIAPPAGRVRSVSLASLRRASPGAVWTITEEIARLLLTPPS